jgi:hypothetical protein
MLAGLQVLETCGMLAGLQVECEASTKPTLNKAAHYYEYIMDEIDPDLIPVWLRETSQQMTQKLYDYYSLTGNIYNVATLLDPVLKLSLYAGPDEPGHVKYQDIRKQCVNALRSYSRSPCQCSLRSPPLPLLREIAACGLRTLRGQAPCSDFCRRGLRTAPQSWRLREAMPRSGIA